MLLGHKNSDSQEVSQLKCKSPGERLPHGLGIHKRWAEPRWGGVVVVVAVVKPKAAALISPCEPGRPGLSRSRRFSSRDGPWAGLPCVSL